MIKFIRPFIPSADYLQASATYVTVPCPEIDLFSRHKKI